MRTLSVAFLVASCVLVGCELFGPKDEEPRSAVGLDLGSERLYRWTFTETDTAGTVQVLQEGDFVVRVVGLDEKLEGLVNLIHVEIARVGSDTVTTDIWYEETEDELIEWAYRNVGVSPLVNLKREAPLGNAAPTASFLYPALLSLSSDATVRQHVLEATTDSIIIRNDPRIVYQFPMNAGDLWTSFRRPFFQKRTVIGLDTLTVEAGTFPCTVIKTEIPLLLPFWRWHDCIGEDGLVLREIIDPVNGSNGNPPFLLRERMEFIGTNQ